MLEVPHPSLDILAVVLTYTRLCETPVVQVPLFLGAYFLRRHTGIR